MDARSWADGICGRYGWLSLKLIGGFGDFSKDFGDKEFNGFVECHSASP